MFDEPLRVLQSWKDDLRFAFPLAMRVKPNLIGISDLSIGFSSSSSSVKANDDAAGTIRAVNGVLLP